jgi:hypothetical protein
MNMMDRGFLYVGVVSIVSLVGIAIFRAIEIPKLYTGASPQEIFVGTLDSNQCYVSDVLPDMSPVPSTLAPHGIKWTAIGDSHSYTITFSNGTPLENSVSTVSVPTGGSSGVQFIDSTKRGNFSYVVQNDKNSCTGKPLPESAWVHISK